MLTSSVSLYSAPTASAHSLVSTLPVEEAVVAPDDVAQRGGQVRRRRVGDERRGPLAADVAVDLLEAAADVEVEPSGVDLVGEVDRVALRLVPVVDVAGAGVEQAVARDDRLGAVVGLRDDQVDQPRPVVELGQDRWS